MTRFPHEFRPVKESRFFDWVEQGCYGSLNSVNRYLPQVFESYVHICHPAWQCPDNVKQSSYTMATDRDKARQLIPTRWAAAAKERYSEFDGKASWGEFAKILDNNNLSPGDIGAPVEGVPPVEVVNVVEKAISIATKPDQDCIFAFWEGFYIMHSEMVHLNKARIVGMSQDGHLLFQAPRSILFDSWRSVLNLDVIESWNPVWTPQAIWCPKQQWFFAIPFFKLSSFFGGTKEMAKVLLKSKEIEAYQIPEGHVFKN